MNYLCAFLLLAFAAGSVQSQSGSNCIAPTNSYLQPIQSLCLTHIPAVFPLNVVTLPLLGAVGTVLQVTGLIINNPVVIVSISGNILRIGVGLNLTCNLLPVAKGAKINIDIQVNLKVLLDGDCAYVTCDPNTLTIKATVAGSLLGLDLTIANAVLQAVTPILNGVVGGVLNTVFAALRCIQCSITGGHIIAGQRCSYAFIGISLQGGLVQANVTVKIAGIAIVISVPAISLGTGDLCVIALPNSVLQGICGLLVGVQISVQLPTGVVTVPLPGNPGSLFLNIRITAITSAAFTSTGAVIKIAVVIELCANSQTGPVIVSVNTVITISASIVLNSNNWGLKVALDASVAIALTKGIDTCGCLDSLLPKLLELVNCNLFALTNVINGILNICLPIPIPFPIPITALVTVTTQTGLCVFHIHL